MTKFSKIFQILEIYKLFANFTETLRMNGVKIETTLQQGNAYR